jgi:predicted enzyme related to lactoylglutathione lyase
MGNYVVAVTGESDDPSGRPTKPGYINGGFYQKTDNPSSHAPSFVISVDDVDRAVKDVVKAGGKILGGMDEKGNHTDKPQMIPGVGLWISVEDTEGNRVSLLQAKM